MRGLIPGLPSPTPLVTGLPAAYHDDDLAGRMLEAFDEVLAPLLVTIDNQDAYLDPRLAPDDFLGWLAECVGAAPDDSWPEERRRRFVLRAAELYRSRGTPAGLAAQIEIFTGGEVDVADSGAVVWSATAGSPVPGEATPSLTVRVRVEDPGSVNEAALNVLIAASKPAHVPHRVEIARL